MSKKFDVVPDQEVAQIMEKIDEEFPMVVVFDEDFQFTFADKKVDVEKLIRLILSLR